MTYDDIWWHIMCYKRCMRSKWVQTVAISYPGISMWSTTVCICMPWLIHVCHIWLIYTCMSWLIHVCDMSWLIHVCDMSWLIHVCDKWLIHRCIPWLILLCHKWLVHMWMPWLIHLCNGWLIRMWLLNESHLTYSYNLFTLDLFACVCHGSFICVTYDASACDSWMNHK